jgi:hypothetical protein
MAFVPVNIDNLGRVNQNITNVCLKPIKGFTLAINLFGLHVGVTVGQTSPHNNLTDFIRHQFSKPICIHSETIIT